MRGEPVEDFGQCRHAASDERVERLELQDFFGPATVDPRGQVEFFDDCLDDLRLFLRRVANTHPQVGAADGENQTRHAAAGADVEHPLALAKVLGKLQAIDDVAADEFFERGMTCEIQLLVPTPKHRAIAVELLDLIGGQFDAEIGERGGEGGGCFVR